LTDCYPIRLFAGFDEREEVGYHAFCSSVIERSTVPVSFTPLSLNTVQKVYGAGHRDGSNGFIYLRFLIPYLQQFEGWAIFVDGADMICNADIAELWAMRDPFKAVQVVKHDYKTKHPRKYVGTAMESGNADYPRKQWSSVMLINCSHYAWRSLTPERVAGLPGSYLHRFEFIEDGRIGELPREWNHLVGEDEPNPDAKLIHYTLGVPAFPHYRHCEHADKWFKALAKANYATS
jgi:lipopolysaccharide biosynthesis glycosyltransferase